MMKVFLNAASRLSELKALEASTMSAASEPSSSKKDFMARMASSVADSWPAQSCWQPTAFNMFSGVTWRTALEMRRVRVSPTPTGLTPGCLYPGQQGNRLSVWQLNYKGLLRLL